MKNRKNQDSYTIPTTMRRNRANPPPPEPEPESEPTSGIFSSFKESVDSLLSASRQFAHDNRREFIYGFCGMVLCFLFAVSFNVMNDLPKKLLNSVFSNVLDDETITFYEGVCVVLYIFVCLFVGIYAQNVLRMYFAPTKPYETRIFPPQDEGEKVRFCDGNTDVSLWVKSQEERHTMLLGERENIDVYRKLKVRLRVCTIEKSTWYMKLLGFEDKHVENIDMYREFDM